MQADARIEALYAKRGCTPRCSALRGGEAGRTAREKKEKYMSAILFCGFILHHLEYGDMKRTKGFMSGFFSFNGAPVRARRARKGPLYNHGLIKKGEKNPSIDTRLELKFVTVALV